MFAAVPLARFSHLLGLTALAQLLVHSQALAASVSTLLQTAGVFPSPLWPPIVSLLALLTLLLLIREASVSLASLSSLPAAKSRAEQDNDVDSAVTSLLSKSSLDRNSCNNTNNSNNISNNNNNNTSSSNNIYHRESKLLRRNAIQGGLATMGLLISVFVPQLANTAYHSQLFRSFLTATLSLHVSLAFLLTGSAKITSALPKRTTTRVNSSLQCRHLVIPNEDGKTVSDSFITNFDKSLVEMANTIEQLRDATASLTFLLKSVASSELAWRASRLLHRSAVRNVEQCVCNFDSIVKSLSRQVNAPKTEKFNIFEVVHRIADMYIRKLEECNVELLVDTPPDSPVEMVEGCLEPLRRILINILSISISNTHPGGAISISASCIQDELKSETVWATFRLRLTNVLSDSFFDLDQDTYFSDILIAADCRYTHSSEEIENGGSVSYLEITMPTHALPKQNWRPFDLLLLHFCESLRGLDVTLYNTNGESISDNLSTSINSTTLPYSSSSVMFTIETVLLKWGVTINTATISTCNLLNDKVIPYTEHSVKSLHINVVYGSVHELQRVYRQLIAQQTRLQPSSQGDITMKPYQCLLFIPYDTVKAHEALDSLVEFDWSNNSTLGNVLVCFVMKPLSTYKITTALLHVVTRARELNKSLYHREMALSSGATPSIVNNNVGGVITTSGNANANNCNNTNKQNGNGNGNNCLPNANGGKDNCNTTPITTITSANILNTLVTPPATPSSHFLQIAAQQSRLMSPVMEKSAFISDSDALMFPDPVNSCIFNNNKNNEADQGKHIYHNYSPQNRVISNGLETNFTTPTSATSSTLSSVATSPQQHQQNSLSTDSLFTSTPQSGGRKSAPISGLKVPSIHINTTGLCIPNNTNASKSSFPPTLTRHLTSAVDVSQFSIVSPAGSTSPLALSPVITGPLTSSSVLRHHGFREDWNSRSSNMAKSRSSPGLEHVALLQPTLPRKPVSPPIKVLIVEDNPINMSILTAFLRKRGIKHDIAKDGIAAVNKFKSHCFHLVLMDLQLPLLDGIEATRQIRAYEKEQNNQASKFGKPQFSTTSSPNTFFMPFPSPELGSTSAALPSSPIIPFDSAVTSLGVSPILGTSGIAGVKSRGVRRSSAMIDGSPGTPPSPMPSSLFRGTKRTPAIIVALTASSSHEDRREALKVGCNDFIIKPINLKWLESKIIEWGSIQALIGFSE